MYAVQTRTVHDRTIFTGIAANIRLLNLRLLYIYIYIYILRFNIHTQSTHMVLVYTAVAIIMYNEYKVRTIYHVKITSDR